MDGGECSMTAMPQRTGCRTHLAHSRGACWHRRIRRQAAEMGVVTRGALGFEVMLGALTTTGSLIAAASAGCDRGQAGTVQRQNAINLLIAIAWSRALCCFGFTGDDGRVLHHACLALCLG